jgi:hypothetical protein
MIVNLLARSYVFYVYIRLCLFLGLDGERSEYALWRALYF